MTAAVAWLRSSILGEVRLGPLEVLTLDDGRDLVLEALDEGASIAATSGAPAPAGRNERPRRLGVVEVVDVDDVVRGGAGAREAPREPDDVLLDHDLGDGRDEDVEARLARRQPELERPARHRRQELEETMALPRRLGEARRAASGSTSVRPSA